MAGTYIYDPSKLGENGKDKMRFELGDTLVDGGEITSPLCDEEYYAILDSTDSWRKAKYELLRAIAMKLSFQADSTSIDGLSYSFSGRAKRWQDMLDKGMINILGRTEWDEARFHHTPQNTSQFKNMDCLFPGFII